MANADESVFSDLLRQTQAVMVINPMIRPHVEQFWQAQEKMLQEAETFSAHWFARRHVATQTALDTVHSIAGDGVSEPAAAMQAMSDWMRQSTLRMSEDIREWTALCTHCAGYATRAEFEAEKEGIEKTAKQLQESTRKHATPV